MAETRSIDEAFEAVVADLHGRGRLRVWSIIITVFGDLSPGADLPASALQQVLEPLGIDAGAVRTAISRLAKDGWITRHKAGRRISYRLEATARPTFDQATRLIYAQDRPVPGGPVYMVVLPEDALPPDGCFTLRRGVYLSTSDVPASDDAMALEVQPDALPLWARSALGDEALATELYAIRSTFGPLAAALGAGSALDPARSAAGRVALIHAWRRAILRHPNVPSAMMPPGWPEAATRAFVLDLHAKLSPGVDAWRRASIDSDMLQNMI